MTTHTPKPWTTNGHSIGVPKGTIATMYRPGDATGRGLTQAEQEANAELIAAAPDLLAACKAARSVAAHMGWNLGPAGKAIEAAIAKAERGTR